MHIRRFINRLLGDDETPTEIIRNQEPTFAEKRLERDIRLSQIRRERLLAAVRSGVDNLDELVDLSRTNMIEDVLMQQKLVNAQRGREGSPS